MDFSLKCNSLKCRTRLTERAIVTTCSHVFCEPCSDKLGLLCRSSNQKICPACQTILNNPDDAVSTQLNPTEDYKTSVLSGFNPNTIVECAGRGLAFWNYQCTQEIVYQEYLAKTLTDKYQSLNVQVDKIVNDANAEIEGLNQRMSQMQVDQDKLKSDNATLAGALRDKTRKYQQVQELYDRLKRKEMTAATQSAAFDSADEVLHAAAQDRSARSNSGGIPYGQYHGNNDRVEHGNSRNRYQESRSTGNSGNMKPPQLHRHNQAGMGQSNRPHENGFMETPQHRIQLGGGPNMLQRHMGPNQFSQPFSAGLQSRTPLIQRPSSMFGSGVNNRLGSGFGLSGGMRRGNQNQQQDFRGYR